MAELNKNEMIKRVEESIKNIEDKNFNVYFVVLDTKGNPSGTLEYLYKTALVLKNKGYNVAMLHQEEDNEFVGVADWLGEEYANLPHLSIGEKSKTNVDIGPSDFLFVPEIFSSVLVHTKQLPCKRVMIMQNYNHLEEFMPVGVTPEDLRVSDIITTTKVQEGILHSFFPNVKTYVVSPSIGKMFRPNDNPRKLIVNIISKNPSDVSRIVKPFYWKYPIYKWVSFRDLRGLSQETFCEALREAAITIWVDDKTNFGYSALEAMRCGSILLAKIPDNLSDWNVDKDEEGNEKLTNSCIWFENIDRLPDMIASVVRSWTLDKIPQNLYDEQHKLDNAYSEDLQEKEIEYVYEKNIFEERLKSFKEVLSHLKNNDVEINEE